MGVFQETNKKRWKATEDKPYSVIIKRSPKLSELSIHERLRELEKIRGLVRERKATEKPCRVFVDTCEKNQESTKLGFRFGEL